MTRARRRPRALVAIPLVLALSATGWWWVTSSSLKGAGVGAGYGVECVDDRYMISEPLGVRMEAGTDCRTSFSLGGGSRDLRLVRIRVPVLGPRGGAVVEATSLEVAGRTYRPLPGRIDAVFDIDRSWSRDQYDDLQMRVVFRASGCTAAGAMFVRPEVTMSALGHRQTLTSVQALRFVTEAPSGEC